MTPTLVTAWKAATATLKAGRIDSPSIDARLLLEVATAVRPRLPRPRQQGTRLIHDRNIVR
jgi:hypothetical protein